MRDRHPAALLSAFLDDELDEGAAIGVARHLDDCPDCLEELRRLREAREALRSLPTLLAPRELFDGVRQSAAEHDRHQTRLRLAAASGSLLALAGVTAFALGGPPAGEVVPPVQVVVADHVARTGGGPMIQPVTFSR